MTRQNVSSSNLRSIGYDSSTRTLEVEFISGSVYQYSNVPASVHSALMAASSHGQYFNANVRTSYSYRQV